jgi:hypothetical protein
LFVLGGFVQMLDVITSLRLWCMELGAVQVERLQERLDKEMRNIGLDVIESNGNELFIMSFQQLSN